MIRDNGDLSVKAFITLIGGFLAVIISLSIILGWKFDNSISAQIQEIRKESEDKYVMKSIHDLQLNTINEKLKAIMRAVGARQPREIP